MKQSSIQKILSESANHVSCQRGIDLGIQINECIIPPEKSVSWYEVALDRAVITLLEYGAEDDIINILKDANNNGYVIKEYLGKIEHVKTYNLFIRKGFLKIKNKNVSLKLFLKFGSITITPKETIITKAVVINDRLGEFIRFLQRTLERIQGELN